MKKFNIMLLVLIVLLLSLSIQAKDFKLAWTHSTMAIIDSFQVQWGVQSYLNPKVNITFDQVVPTFDTLFTVTIPDDEMTTNGGYQVWFRVLAFASGLAAISDTLTYTEYFRADMERDPTKSEVTARDHALFQDRFQAIYQRPALNFIFPKRRIPDVQPQF